MHVQHPRKQLIRSAATPGIIFNCLPPNSYLSQGRTLFSKIPAYLHFLPFSPRQTLDREFLPNKFFGAQHSPDNNFHHRFHNSTFKFQIADTTA